MRPLPRGTDPDDNAKQAQTLLSEERWLFEEFQVFDRKKEERWGLAFAHPTRLKILEERGYLIARHYCIPCRPPFIPFRYRIQSPHTCYLGELHTHV